MPCTEAYKEHIIYTFHGFYPLGTTDEYTTGYQIHRTLKFLRKEMEVLSHGESEPYPL